MNKKNQIPNRFFKKDYRINSAIISIIFFHQLNSVAHLNRDFTFNQQFATRKLSSIFSSILKNLVQGAEKVKMFGLKQARTEGSKAPRTAFGSSDLSSLIEKPTIESHPEADGAITPCAVIESKFAKVWRPAITSGLAKKSVP